MPEPGLGIWTALAVLGGLACLWLAALWYLRNVWFFRDPARVPVFTEGAILSPADGIVVYVKPYADSKVTAEKLGAAIPVTEITKYEGNLSPDGWVVGVYMSPLDVHFNYAPTDGEVMEIVATPASVNLPMVDLWEYIKLTYLRRAVNLFAAKYRLVNERNTIFIRARSARGAELRYAAVEIADKFVNKIDCFVSPGETVHAGQKISFIRRGSQVDLILPKEGIAIECRPGQRVTGGITVLARMAG